MENKIRQSILKTVLYADIFDYPLTSKQLWKYLISEKKISKKNFDKALANLPEKVSSKSGLYFIKGRRKLISRKIEMMKESGKKFSVAYQVISVLSKVPWVLFIGISGGLSMENSGKHDDIDIFVITIKDRIWVTRISLIMLLKIMGKYRGRTDKKIGNKICLNMLVDEENLSFEKKDIYIAHEISQLIPVFDIGIYNRFINENLWVKKYMPNALPELESKKIKKVESSTLVNFMEFIAGKIQLQYMKKNITIEQIGKGFLSFHPFDYDSFVILQYNKKLKKYGQKI